MNAHTSIDTHQQAAPPVDLARLLDNTEEDEGIRLDIKRILWGVWQRRLQVILAVVVATVIGVTIALTLVEPTWRAKTTLIQKESQDEFRVGRYGIPFKQQEYSFKTLLDTLLLPSSLETAMQRAGINMPTREFASLVDIHLGKESKAFSVSVLFNDPGTSAALTNHLADVFIERNRDLRRREIENQLINYRTRLESAQHRSRDATEALRNFEAGNEISDIGTQLQVLLEKRQEVEVVATRVEGDLIAKREQLTRLGGSIEGEPDMIVQTSYFVNPMAKNLAQLEWELAQARGRYTTDNPKVKDLMQRIEKIKTIIEDGKDEQTPSQTFAHNPVKQELSITRYEVEAEILRLRTQSTQLAEMVASLTSRIARLTETRKQHEVLEAKRAAAETLMRDLRERVDSMEVLYRGDLGDFAVLERAAVPQQRESSGRKLIVIGVVMLGGAIGVGMALASELLYPRLRTLKDLGFLGQFEVEADFVSSSAPLIHPSEPITTQAAAYRRFTNDLQIALDRTKTRSIGFAGITSGSAASTAAMNMAISLYLKGETVVFVDADLRDNRDNLRMPHSKLAPPLLTMLRGLGSTRSLSRGLTYVPAAHHNERTETTVLEIGGVRMDAVRRSFTHPDVYVIYNLPPLGEEEASFEALKQIGTLALVTRSNKTRRNDVARMMTRLEHHGVRTVAGIIADVPEDLMTTGTIEPARDLKQELSLGWQWVQETGARLPLPARG